MMTISKDILNRKGARKPAEVPVEVLDLLNQGMLETVNLSEWLAIDQRLLFQNISRTLLLPAALVNQVLASLDEEKKPTNNTFMKVIGRVLEQNASNPETLREKLQLHTSDVARCWAAHMVGTKSISLEKKLEMIRMFAADDHFGVREVAFMSVKPAIADQAEEAVSILESWVISEDPNVRRFAVESTRPIGVWTNKIDTFKQHPEKGFALLDPLRSDESKYVQDAVANWLNDASKTQPGWVEDVCNKWSGESESKHTSYIVKRALRTINKSK